VDAGLAGPLADLEVLTVHDQLLHVLKPATNRATRRQVTVSARMPV